MSAWSRGVTRGGGPSGFTLLEMIVVLVVMGLVLAFVVPSIGRGSGRHALAATARDVAAALRLARDRAIARNRPTRFIANGNAFGLNEDKDLRHAPRGIALTAFADGRKTLGEGGGAIDFFPDGSSTGGGIDVTNGAAHYAVVIDWITGDVSVQAQPATPRP